MHEGVYVVIDGTVYRVAGWLGCQIKSRERGVKVGDVRLISDTLFHAYMVDSSWVPFTKGEISWCIVYSESDLDTCNKEIRDFYKRVGVYVS